MQIGRFDSRKLDLRKLAPEFKVAVAISFVLYAVLHTAILMGWL
jgi:hypothetical protein